MKKLLKESMGASLAALLAISMIGASSATAQVNTQAGGTAQTETQNTPPAGQNAPPPPGYGADGTATYDQHQQQADEEYAREYEAWAQRYCVNQQANKTAAGAIIGGVLGAGIGAAVSHNPATGAAIGGAIGAGTGAVAGASQPNYGCPPGYVVAAGAPAFAYSGPYWGSAVWWAPAWYHPWVWVGGHWYFYPYRWWYWWHGRAWWRPGWGWHAWHPWHPGWWHPWWRR